MWPLKFRLGAEYDVQANDVTATAECRDAFLGGEVTLDVLHRSVEYSKRFDLGGVSQIALRGRCDLGDLGGGSRGGKSSSGLSSLARRFDASFGFVIEPKAAEVRGIGTTVSSTTKGYDVVAEIPLSKLLSAEVCGHVSVPLPTAEFTAHTAGGGRLALGRGNVTAHVAQINAVVNL